MDVGAAKIDCNKFIRFTANIDKPGNLVIHNSGAGALPASLVHIALLACENANITVEGDGPLVPSIACLDNLMADN